MKDILCIFTSHGKTFTFKNVTILCDNETTLSFSYVAMSDGRTKVAVFQKSNICGFSTAEEIRVEMIREPEANTGSGRAHF